jgi:DsbC/DsbD-like thiol-disulfide interchange protein
MSPRLLLLALLLAGPVAARAELPPEVVRMEVLPGWRTGDGGRMAGLRLTLAPGWKTYWRSPGAAGLPPKLDFAASEGIAGVEAHWPVPELFFSGGLRSIGYAGTVTIPLELSLAGGPARLRGEVEIGVCHDICVPVRLPVALDLPETDAARRDPAIAAALVDRPLSAQEAGARATCAARPGPDGGLALTLRLALPPQGGEEAVVVEAADPSLWFSEPRARREGGTLVAELEAEARDGGAVALDRDGLRITVLGDGRAVDIRGCEAG